MGSLLGHKSILVLAMIYTGLLTWGSLIKVSLGSEVPDNFDKLLHLTAYLGLALVWLMVIWSARLEELSLKPMIVVVLAAIVYGIIIEVLQGSFTDHRTLDIWDVAANSIGAILGVIIFALIINKSGRLKSIF